MNESVLENEVPLLLWVTVTEDQAGDANNGWDRTSEVHDRKSVANLSRLRRATAAGHYLRHVRVALLTVPLATPSKAPDPKRPASA